ncbi:MAG TPA: hypothetical protein VEP49_12885 [Acidimicrobiia bacterium]|nr:hypothetical protein [Acidimicrobiia bacterium]
MPDVVVVRWPEQRDEAARLARAGNALLYLVSGNDEPPLPTTCLEDWVRVPGDERDLRARLAALEVRANSHLGPPRIDDTGTLHFRGKSVHLSSVQARLVGALVAEYPEVVPDDVLVERAGGGSDPLWSLRSEMARLRARTRPLGLLVRRVTNRGYRMQEQ